MSASLVTRSGTMLWAAKASSSTLDYRDIYAQPADGRPVRWIATAYWSSSQLAWRYAGRNWADLHSLMRYAASGLEDS